MWSHTSFWVNHTHTLRGHFGSPFGRTIGQSFPMTHLLTFSEERAPPLFSVVQRWGARIPFNELATLGIPMPFCFCPQGFFRGRHSLVQCDLVNPPPPLRLPLHLLQLRLPVFRCLDPQSLCKLKCPRMWPPARRRTLGTDGQEFAATASP